MLQIASREKAADALNMTELRKYHFMRNALTAFGMLGCLLLCQCVTTDRQGEESQPIIKVKLCYLPEQIFISIAMSPESLECDAEITATESNSSWSNQVSELMDQKRTQLDSNRGDFRVGWYFVDSLNHKHEIAIDRIGKVISVDGDYFRATQDDLKIANEAARWLNHPDHESDLSRRMNADSDHSIPLD